MRISTLAAALLVGAAAPALALAQVSVNIGIDLPLLPRLVRVPGYPVYYAPQLRSNYFFYDGVYWVFEHDGWYASDWYNGPWRSVGMQSVPLFVLRVPVRYYRSPPSYFRGWRADASPRWADHWGPQWEAQNRGWDLWDHRAAPAAAPLPTYQRRYGGERYPRAEQQQELHARNYRYRPHDPVVRQQFESHGMPQPDADPRAHGQGRSRTDPGAAPRRDDGDPGAAQRAPRTPPESGRGDGRDKDRGGPTDHGR